MNSELCELPSLNDTMSHCAVLYRTAMNSLKVTLALTTSLPPLKVRVDPCNPFMLVLTACCTHPVSGHCLCGLSAQLCDSVGC